MARKEQRKVSTGSLRAPDRRAMRYRLDQGIPTDNKKKLSTLSEKKELTNEGTFRTRAPKYVT